MNLRHPAALALTMVVVVVVVGACQASGSSAPASVAPPSVPATTSPLGSSSAPSGPAPSASDPGGGIDPDWVTRPALTCGDNDRLFPPEALAGPGLAELGMDPAAEVLRTTIAGTGDYPFPDAGWYRVLDDPGGVTFVARGDAATPWVTVTVGVLGGALQATEYGQCTLAIAAPDGVTFARWWLDPAGPPVTPESTELAILLRERACASGKEPIGRVLAPTIITTPDAFEVAIGIRKTPGGADCPGNPAFAMGLALPEPLGSRGLFDASQYPARPVTTEDPG